MELRELLGVLRRRAWILVVVPVTSALTALLASLFLVTPVYEASATALVIRREMPLTWNDTLLNRGLTRTYSEIVRSRTVLGRVISEAGLREQPDELAKRIRVDTVRDTEILGITVSSSDPREAAALANLVTRAFIGQVNAIMKVDTVQVVDPATEPVHPVRPRPLLNTAIAGALGAMAGVGLALLLENLDTTIRTSEDVERHLGLPVLAAVPVFAAAPAAGAVVVAEAAASRGKGRKRR